MKTITGIIALALASLVHAAPQPVAAVDESSQAAGSPPPSTEPRPPTPPEFCSNYGVEWAYIPNTSGNNTDTVYSSFLPEKYTTRTPTAMGRTTTIGGIRTFGFTGDISIYNAPRPLPATHFVLEHRGYIFAKAAGTYTFKVGGVDDILFIWIGPKAWSGWTRANADSIITMKPSGPGSGSFSKTLEYRQYYPVRILYAQAQGAALFDLSLTGPDGSVILGERTLGDIAVENQGCPANYKWAPVYDPWVSQP